MALCSLCPEPGHCCKKFSLFARTGEEPTFWKDNWLDSAQQEAIDRGLPFRPLRINGEYEVESSEHPHFGREYVTVYFYCPKLSEDGRCTIYPIRPELCRDFVPGSGALCVLHGLV